MSVEQMRNLHFDVARRSLFVIDAYACYTLITTSNTLNEVGTVNWKVRVPLIAGAKAIDNAASSSGSCQVLKNGETLCVGPCLAKHLVSIGLKNTRDLLKASGLMSGELVIEHKVLYYYPTFTTMLDRSNWMKTKSTWNKRSIGHVYCPITYDASTYSAETMKVLMDIGATLCRGTADALLEGKGMHPVCQATMRLFPPADRVALMNGFTQPRLVVERIGHEFWARKRTNGGEFRDSGYWKLPLPEDFTDFSDSNDGGMSNFALLSLSGDVETNPGPLSKLSAFLDDVMDSKKANKLCHQLLNVAKMPYQLVASIISGVRKSAKACFVVAVCGFVAYVLRLISNSRVVVVNSNGVVDVNDMKDRFAAALRHVPPAAHRAGHEVLAAERRVLESHCFAWLLQSHRRVRDVGGSRSRHPHLGMQKHICCPTFDNEDILRNLKSHDLFENCGRQGEDCPFKPVIPAAILSHVDYHMTTDQLVRTIVGPTFIINHPFDKSVVGVGEYKVGTKIMFEADVMVSGGLVTQTTADGTKYRHTFHAWENEGSVVTKSGAFVYVRVAKYGSSQVLFAYPADGVYVPVGVNVMDKVDASPLPMINKLSVRVDDGQYVFADTRADRALVPVGLVQEVAMGMCSSVRDSKYHDTMRSMIVSKMKSKQLDLANINLVYALCAYLSDDYALSIACDSSSIHGKPVDYTWKDRVIMSALLRLKRFAPTILAKAVEAHVRSKAGRLTEWTFPKVIVPVYEVYNRGKFEELALKGRTAGRELFPAKAAPVDAGRDKQPECSSSKDPCQHGDIAAHSSTECGTKAPPIPAKRMAGRPVFNFGDGPANCPTPVQRDAASGPANASSTRENDDGPKPCPRFTFTEQSSRPRYDFPMPGTAAHAATARGVDERVDVVSPVRPDAVIVKITTVEKSNSSRWWAICDGFGAPIKVTIPEDYVFDFIDVENRDTLDQELWFADLFSRLRDKGWARPSIAKLLGSIFGIILSTQSGRSVWTAWIDGPRLSFQRPPASHEHHGGAFAVQDMVVEISDDTPHPVGTGAQRGSSGRAFANRRGGKKFPQDRNEHESHRSAEHFASIGQVPRGDRSVHLRSRARPGASSFSGQRFGPARPSRKNERY